MKPITAIYWIRTATGIAAGAICAVFANFLMTHGMEGTSVLLYSISLTLLIYLLSVQILKKVYQNKVEKPSKITTTAIIMYFITWLVFYTLFYTIIISI